MTDHAPAPGVAHDAHGAHDADHAEHPTWSTYWKVALILTLITVVEVWIYYVPSIYNSKWFVPSLLIMSAVAIWTMTRGGQVDPHAQTSHHSEDADE